MLDSEIYAKVVLLTGGYTYIVFNTGKIIECTAQTLSYFSYDAKLLNDRDLGRYINVQNKINPKGLPFNEIPGLTLAKFSNSSTLECEFPVIFKKMFSNIFNSKFNAPIILDFVKEPHLAENNKSLFIHFFSTLANIPLGRFSLKNEYTINEELPAQIFDTAIGMLCSDISFCNDTQENFDDDLFFNQPFDEAMGCKDTEPENGVVDTLDDSNEIPYGYITMAEFAELRKVTYATVRSWVSDKKLEGYHKKLSNNKVYIDPEAIVRDKRKERNNRKENEKNNRPKSTKDTPIEEIRKHIIEDGIVTEAIAPFIYSSKEASYYKNRSYHEIIINGKHALTIDINPEYFCKSLGKTNRELIMEGRSPVIPGDEGHRYHLHHVGQKKDSPLAIIPETDHNSEEFSSVFHHKKKHIKDIHDKNFEKEKAAFWKEYLRLYDEHEQKFSKIPYLNPRQRALKNPQW